MGWRCIYPQPRKRIFSYCESASLNLVECLCEVVDDVVDVLRADAETDGRRCDVLLGQFLGREL